MADICKETLLGGKQRFEPFQCLIEGTNQISNFIILRSMIRDTAREIVCAVDLLDGFRNRFKRLQGLTLM